MGDWGLLGEVLAREPSDRNRANVKDLVARAKDLLKLVRETFPTYTMHDEQHAENVIALMGQLAAPRREAMTPLEAALLVLAAYFHDAGMAYSRDELTAAPAEDEFRVFLEGNDEAYLATRLANGVPPPEVIEQYCRSRHAGRVRVHLERCDRSLLQWDGASIIEPLVTICRSHNEPAAALHELRFKTDFFYQADLRACAVLLRLADVLDLDDTRAPKVIYDHLDLARGSMVPEAVSDREWSKHLAARGFVFPPSPPPNYTIQFVAEPTNPGVEHDLRAFLGVITDELLQCRSVVDICDDRWRGMPLPAEIDTSAITSHGYKYGEFRFELDRTAMLELFTGDNLYRDPYAFIRELLQNALDATRARAHLFGHESTGIHVTCWEDDGGFVWVRVDDDGIGMDEGTLRRYFLRAGKSYYRSTEFRAELARRGRTDRPFGVIGRFGVGVLACFMVGDTVEITSRRQPVDGRVPKGVRLSINQRDDFFVLQESDRAGTPMPGRSKPESAFLAAPGTRIAVRIDPNRIDVNVRTLLDRVQRYVFAPPVPIFANGRMVAEESSAMLSEPLLAAPLVANLNTADLDLNMVGLGTQSMPIPYVGDVRIVAVPLDLTGTHVSPDLKGQALACFATLSDTSEPRPAPWLTTADEELNDILSESITTTKVRLSHRPHNDVSLVAVQEIDMRRFSDARELLESRGVSAIRKPSPTTSTAASKQRDLAENPGLLLDALTLDPLTSFTGKSNSRMSLPPDKIPAGELFDRIAGLGDWLSYNGIRIPTDKVKLGAPDALIAGTVALSGRLRPNLDVSRESIRSLPVAALSAIHLAVRRAIGAALSGNPLFPMAEELMGAAGLRGVVPAEPSSAAMFLDDPLVTEGVWNAERIISTASGTVSVNEILAGDEEQEIFLPRRHDWESFPRLFEFYPALVCGLLHHFVDLRLSLTGPQPPSPRLASRRRPTHPAGAMLLPPLFAVPYDSDESLARAGSRLNASHPLARWLLGKAEILAVDFPAPFQRTFRTIVSTSVEQVNEALDRVARSRPDIAPPLEAYLRQDEKGWWWSR